MKGIIIQGSARSQGNTHLINTYIQQQTGFDLIDLRSKRIEAFDYEFRNSDDDFIPLMETIAANYDLLIFATPVYWYSMSGIMKNFFDRITDCLKTHKDIGRQLRGKSMALVSCGSDALPVAGFEMPFEKSAHYLGMNYRGHLHTWIEHDAIPETLHPALQSFTKTVLELPPGNLE